MSETPLAFLTLNFYDDFFGFLNRYDCAKLLTANKAIANDVSKYVASSSFADLLYSEKDGYAHIIINGTRYITPPITDLYHYTSEIKTTHKLVINEIPYELCSYTNGILRHYKKGWTWDVHGDQQIKNIMYDYRIYRYNKRMREIKARAKQKEIVRMTKKLYYYNGETLITPPWRK
jgi:hypothetical protein